MAAVTFDPAAFRASYPEFKEPPATPSVTDGKLQDLFALATMILDNSGCSVVQDEAQRTALLNLLVAHLATLHGLNSNSPNAAGMAGAVGRVASATEGSVSVSYDFPSTDRDKWFNQTGYGASFWQMTARYRTFRYIGYSRQRLPGDRGWNGRAR